jgi:hypothetical protein
MAKVTVPPPVPVSVSYRVERVNTYGWQAYAITLLSDSTTVTAPVFKQDLFDIVLRNIGTKMKAEGQVNFLAAKRKGA